MKQRKSCARSHRCRMSKALQSGGAVCRELTPCHYSACCLLVQGVGVAAVARTGGRPCVAALRWVRRKRVISAGTRLLCSCEQGSKLR